MANGQKANRGKKLTKVQQLTPDERNLNRGTERGNQMLEQSLRQYGAGRSILIDKHGKIIAGNKTLENAAAIGLDDLLVVQTDGRKIVAVQRMDLDLDKDKAARELAIADNRSAELDIEWDVGLLAQVDMETLGKFFTEGELEKLLGQAPDSFPEVGEDLETEHVCPKCGYKFSGGEKPKPKQPEKQPEKKGKRK